MQIIENIIIANQAYKEVLKFFFSDGEEMIKQYNLDDTMSPVSRGVYRTLCQFLKWKKGYCDEGVEFEILKKRNFCYKACYLLPKLYMVSEEHVKSGVNRIMELARDSVDADVYKDIHSSSQKSYVTYPRQNLINTYDFDISEDEGIENIRKEHTQSQVAKDMLHYINNASDQEIDSPYNNDYKTYSREYNIIAQKEEQKIEAFVKNYAAMREIKDNVIDEFAYTYRGVVLAPSTVQNEGNNRALFKHDNIFELSWQVKRGPEDELGY